MNPSAPPLILASKSASRRSMLEKAGVPFIAVTSHVDEALIKVKFKSEGKSVNETALALAHAKAAAVAKAQGDALVLGADQMLECDGRWLDKAETADDAKEQLAFLSGKTHRLVTAAVLLRGDETAWTHSMEAHMQVRVLSKTFIDTYCAQLGDALLSSVGCYALEGLGSQLFEKVEGDFFGILGLPLIPLLQPLRSEGILTA